MSEEGSQYRHSWSDDGPIHETIVAALAEELATPPDEIPPLQSAVDVGALDELLEPRDGDGGLTTVSFTYQELTVTAQSDGVVVITPRT